MKKLYAKNELLFSLLLIAVYVFGTSAAESISVRIGQPCSVTFAFHAVLCGVLLAFLCKNNLTKSYGLCKTDRKAAHFLYYVPFAWLVSVNFWFGIGLQKPPLQSALQAGSMLCVGFAEEIIFRGFLFRAMAKDNVKTAVVVSSVTFGIGHVINLLNGAQILPTVCQILYATAFGFLCVTVFYKGKTLLPCIVTHSAVNALSVFANENISDVQTVVSSLALFLIAGAYALYLRRSLSEVKDNNKKYDL